MSYYSTVRMVTTIDGFTKMHDEVKSFLQQHCCPEELNLLHQQYFDYYAKDDNGIYFGWDSIRWYDQFYPEIMAMVHAIEVLESTNIEFQFLRIGENFNDIEEIYRLKTGKLKPFYPHVSIIGGLTKEYNDSTIH